MCGRYTVTAETKALVERFNVQQSLFEQVPRFNVSPSQEVPIVRLEDDSRVLRGFQWGFTLHAGKTEKELINARAETVDEKPTFKKAFRERRCLVIADGFYEWRTLAGKKQPIYFKLKDGTPFAFAGLWTENKDGETRCLHITTTANELVRPVHNRMPVILRSDAEDDWLTSAPDDHDFLLNLLQPYPPELMESYAVSSAVNSPEHDSPECIEPQEG